MIYKTPEDLKKLANQMARDLLPSQTLGLIGELGAGKTTFVRYLAEALGTKDWVSSPSYVLENRYQLPNGIELVHQDLYRMQVLDLEFAEPAKANEIKIIEWIDKFPELQHKADIVIRFTVLDEGREVILDRQL